MKFYPCGSLSDLINSQATKPLLKNIIYTNHLAVKLTVDVASGLMAIHQEGLFHSDIKVSLRNLYFKELFIILVTWMLTATQHFVRF
jgi:serine/threonine protein kinase